ncbi:MAG: hypothetical protein ACHQE5_12430 [Actinomycetes bacterium]
MTATRRRAVAGGVAMCAALASMLAGCSSASSPRPPTDLASPHVTAGDSGSTGGPPASSAPPQPIGATGSLLAQDHGTGPRVVAARASRPGVRLTVRLTCSGPGPARVTDASGGLILGTGGCEQGVIFSSAWSATKQDGRSIRVVVDPTTSWALELWSGTVPDHDLST